MKKEIDEALKTFPKNFMKSLLQDTLKNRLSSLIENDTKINDYISVKVKSIILKELASILPVIVKEYLEKNSKEIIYMHIDDIVDEGITDEISKKIQKIMTDAVLKKLG